MIRRNLIAGASVALAVSAPAAAQVGAPTTDISGEWTDGAYVVKTGLAFNVVAFGICKTVVNSAAYDIYIPLKDLKEFQLFIANPQSGVTVTDCGCGSLLSGQVTTQTSMQSQACPSPQTGTETRTEFQQMICQDGTMLPDGAPTFSPWDTSQCVADCGATRVFWAAPGVQCSALIPAASANTNQSVSADNGLSGTAIFRCTAGAWDFSTGSCGLKPASPPPPPPPPPAAMCTDPQGVQHPSPQTQADCNNAANYPPDPICVWSGWAWGDYQQINVGFGTPWCFGAVEYQSIQVWNLGSDGCCHVTEVPTPCNGQPGATGRVNCGVPIIYETPPGISSAGFINGKVGGCQATDFPTPSSYPPGTCPDGNSPCTFWCDLDGNPR